MSIRVLISDYAAYSRAVRRKGSEAEVQNTWRKRGRVESTSYSSGNSVDINIKISSKQSIYSASSPVEPFVSSCDQKKARERGPEENMALAQLKKEPENKKRQQIHKKKICLHWASGRSLPASNPALFPWQRQGEVKYSERRKIIGEKGKERKDTRIVIEKKAKKQDTEGEREQESDGSSQIGYLSNMTFINVHICLYW